LCLQPIVFPYNLQVNWNETSFLGCDLGAASCPLATILKPGQYLTVGCSFQGESRTATYVMPVIHNCTLKGQFHHVRHVKSTRHCRVSPLHDLYSNSLYAVMLFQSYFFRTSTLAALMHVLHNDVGKQAKFYRLSRIITEQI
jgi:hypothetical protein